MRTSSRHSAGRTPLAPMARLISDTSSTGPTSSDVPLSAIAAQPPAQAGVLGR